MYYSLCLVLASVCPDYLQPHLCPEFSLISVGPDIYVSQPMNNELTVTASTQGVPFRDYHWTINPRAALETGANAPLARPGGMLGLVFSLSVRLRDLEGNKQRNFSFPPLEKTPPSAHRTPVVTPATPWGWTLTLHWPRAKMTHGPPLRRGPSHLPGNKSWPST